MTIAKSLLDPTKAAYDHVVPACTPWSGLVRKGQCLRIIDVAGQQAQCQGLIVDCNTS